MATVASSPDAKAKADLGLQDSVLGCLVSSQCKENHIYRCRSGECHNAVNVCMQWVFIIVVQIVRADLKDLLEVPLDGAPYAYTPFCNSRPDMEGFRCEKIPFILRVYYCALQVLGERLLEKSPWQ